MAGSDPEGRWGQSWVLTERLSVWFGHLSSVVPGFPERAVLKGVFGERGSPLAEADTSPPRFKGKGQGPRPSMRGGS